MTALLFIRLMGSLHSFPTPYGYADVYLTLNLETGLRASCCLPVDISSIRVFMVVGSCDFDSWLIHLSLLWFLLLYDGIATIFSCGWMDSLGTYELFHVSPLMASMTSTLNASQATEQLWGRVSKVSNLLHCSNWCILLIRYGKVSLDFLKIVF